MLEASIKIPKEILFCKKTGLYISYTKPGLVVRGHLAPFGMFFVTSCLHSEVSIEYITAPVSLTESVFM